MAVPAPKLEHPSEFGEDLTPEQEQKTRDWISEARVHRRGSERREERAVDSIKPTAPIDTKVSPVAPVETQQSVAEEPAGAAANKESTFAGRLRRLREAKQKELAALAEEASAKGKLSAAVNKYKHIKRIVQAVKIISAAGASVGDILVSAGTWLVTAHGEWIYSKFNANYPFAPWERRVVIFVDIIIFLELLAIAVIITVIYQQYQGGGSTLLKFIGK